MQYRADSINRISFYLLTALLLFACSVPGFAAPSVKAGSAILINARTGGVIYEKNADTRRNPASLTKIMTCILGLEEKGLDATFKVSMAAAATEYSDLGMAGGDRILSGELMRGMMLESDNGAAVVVAQNVSGNILNFADCMNDKAKELGCRRTHFSNPHGLTAKWHYTTARDMAKIAAYGMKNDDFRRIVSTQSSVIHWVSPAGKTYKADTTNRLLGSYSGANGIKTGWTSAAQGCLAAAAKRGDVELIAIVLKSPDGQTRFEDARKLLDYGFSVGGKGKIVTETTQPATPKRMPNIKKPTGAAVPAKAPAAGSSGTTDRTVANKPITSQPAAVAAPAVRHPIVSAPAKTVPATSPAPVAADNPQTAAANPPQPVVAAGPANAETNGNTVSSKPVVKNTGIRMPIVRKPGA